MVTMVAVRRVALALATALAACNAIVGIGDPVVVNANSCVHDSDCARSTDVCLFQICSAVCQADRDCGGDKRCLVTGPGAAACVGASSQCNDEGDCPGIA
ncbi:MAG TPA: hypothetical protein VGQ57_14320, partial [Polyangiaceae bacterium]|nr:hypothetical protein [Polyangiaceae bacterium]